MALQMNKVTAVTVAATETQTMGVRNGSVTTDR